MKSPLGILLLALGLAARPCLAAEDLIVMQGGISTGDPCEPLGYHSFNGIERETMDAIKRWIRQGG